PSRAHRPARRRSRGPRPSPRRTCAPPITEPSGWYSNSRMPERMLGSRRTGTASGGVMPRPPLARERVLDAYETILLTEGERAATLEGVAAAAGVSKGGLLYHFASKDQLADGLL